LEGWNQKKFFKFFVLPTNMGDTKTFEKKGKEHARLISGLCVAASVGNTVEEREETCHPWRNKSATPF